MKGEVQGDARVEKVVQGLVLRWRVLQLPVFPVFFIVVFLAGPQFSSMWNDCFCNQFWSVGPQIGHKSRKVSG